MDEQLRYQLASYPIAGWLAGWMDGTFLLYYCSCRATNVFSSAGCVYVTILEKAERHYVANFYKQHNASPNGCVLLP